MKFVIDKDIDDITLNDIEFLVNNQIPESVCLDYKLQNYNNTSGGKKELLKDITAFANSSGGDLIIGIGDDKYNQASILRGIESDNIAEDINSMEQVIYNGTEPKLNTFKIKHIQLPNKKYVIIIRVFPSSLFPHMVSFQKTSKFYIRKSDKNILLDAYELRNIFLKSENIMNNIRKENKKRIFNVFSNEIIIPLNNNSKILINFIPYNSIDSNKNIIDINKIKLNFPEQRINFDGILGYKTDQNGIESYCQIYRNGIFEFASSTDKLFFKTQNPFSIEKDEINVISGEKNGFEYLLLKRCNYFFNFMKKLNIELPIYLFITLLDTKGYRIIYKKENSLKLTNSIDRDILELPEIELKNYNVDIKKYIYEIINMIWNACGEEKSINFDINKNWLGNSID